MAQADRAVSGDLSLFTVGEALAATVKNASFTGEVETVDNSALLDRYTRPKEVKRSGRLSATCAAETTDAMAMLGKICLTIATPGTVSLSFDFRPYATGKKITGTCLLTSVTHNIDQEQSFTIEAVTQGGYTIANITT